VNLQTDLNHCGTCTDVCGAGTTCCGGGCDAVGGSCMPGGNECQNGTEECVGTAVQCVATSVVPDGNICGPGIGGLCCGGSCVAGTEFCTDADGDGHGETSGDLAFGCPGTAPPPGFGIGCDDCCGTDPHVFVGSTWCDSIPTNCSGSTLGVGFDYDCNCQTQVVTCDVSSPTNHFVTTNVPANCFPMSASCTNASGTCTAVCSNGPDGDISNGGGQSCAGACSWVDTNNCGESMDAFTTTCDPSCATATVTSTFGPVTNCH
jgi:hypothetical protein